MKARVLLGMGTAAAAFAMTGGTAMAANEDFCSVDPTAPCVVSATLNGTPLNTAVHGFDVSTYSEPGSDDVSWSVSDTTNEADSLELGADTLDDVWTITIDVGSIVPRVIENRAANAQITRTDDGDGTYKVTTTGSPVIMLDNDSCVVDVYPWFCPEIAPDERVGYLEGRITAYDTWTDVDERIAMYGMNYSSNIQVGSIPPEVAFDGSGNPYIFLRLAGSHFRPDGTTLFHGFANLRIPNQFLKEVYGIDNPSSLVGSSLVTSVSGTGSGTATASLDPDGGGILVDVADMSFSQRVVRIKPDLRPTRPGDVRGKRVSPRRGKLSFTSAEERGSRITGYAAKCAATRGAKDVEGGRGDDSPVRVGGLREGTPYECRVRAIAKAEPGRWSAPVKITGGA